MTRWPALSQCPPLSPPPPTLLCTTYFNSRQNLISVVPHSIRYLLHVFLLSVCTPYLSLSFLAFSRCKRPPGIRVRAGGRPFARSPTLGLRFGRCRNARAPHHTKLGDHALPPKGTVELPGTFNRSLQESLACIDLSCSFCHFLFHSSTTIAHCI